MKVICVLGLIGSGKDAVSRYLVQKYGYTLVNSGDFLREIARNRGLKPNRQTVSKIFKEYLKEHGEGGLARELMSYVKGTGSGKIVFNTTRTNEQAEELKKQFPETKFLLITAPQKTRFERMKKRMRAGDPKTFDDFMKQEEMDLRDYPLKGIFLEYSDYKIDNSRDFESLKSNVDGFVEKFRLS